MSKNGDSMNILSTQHLATNNLENFSISDEAKSYFLSDMLPYDPNIKKGDRIMTAIREYNFLLKIAQNATEKLCGGFIDCFDPLVGENACQIRALKNCLIFSKYPINTDNLLFKIQCARQKTSSLLKDVSTLPRNNLSLGNLLENKDMDIRINYRELYLFYSYLLTLVKVVKTPKKELPFIENAYTDTKKLMSVQSVPRRFADRLINKARESLSFFSVSFVQEISSKIAPDFFHDSLSNTFCIRHNRLYCLPCYWVTKILMIQALESQIPLIIIARQLAKDKNYEIIRECLLVFKPSMFGYQESSISAFDLNTPSMLLIVNSCRESFAFPDLKTWKKELLQNKPIDLILAYAASHRQYPDETQDELVNQLQDNQYKFYKEKAIEWGCSIKNPFGFFLSHAFSEKIQYVSNHLALKNSTIFDPEKSLSPL